MSPEANRNMIELIDDRIKDVTKLIAEKVSWIVFSFIILLFLALMGYLASADASIKDTVDKNEERFYQYQKETNAQLSDLKTQLSAVSERLGVKDAK